MDFEWEIISACGGGAGRGEAWKQYPCVSVHKSGVTFNGMAATAFTLSRYAAVMVLCDTARNVLGFKFQTPTQETADAFTIQKMHSNTGACKVACIKAGEKFPFALGKAYRLQPSTNDVIVASLTQENCVS